MSFVLLILTCATVTFASFISGLTGFGNGSQKQQAAQQRGGVERSADGDAVRRGPSHLRVPLFVVPVPPVIFQMCWSVMESWGVSGAGELKAGVAISYLMNPVNIAYLAPTVLKVGAVRWELVLAFSPGTIFFGFVGTAALSTLNQGGLKKGLGLLFFVFALWQLTLKLRAIKKGKEEVHKQFLESVSEAQRSRVKMKADMIRGASPLATINGKAAAAHHAASSPSPATAPQSQSQQASAAPADHPAPTLQLLDSPHDFPSVDHRDDEDVGVDLLKPGVSSSGSISAGGGGGGAAGTVPAGPATSHQPYVQLVQIESGGSAGHGANGAPLSSPLSSPNGFAPSTALGAASPVLSPVTLPASRPRPPSTPPRPLRCGSFWGWLWSWSHHSVFLGALGAGMASGFLQGLFGTGGPPIIFFFSLVDITKADIRGTSIWSNMVQLLPRFIFMLYFGIFDFPALWPLYLCTIPSTLLGTYCGNAVFKYVDVNAVLMVLQGLVLISTISLTNATDGSVFGDIMLCIYMVLVVLFSAAAIYLSSMHWRFLRERPVSEVELWVEQTARRKEKEKEAKRAAAAPSAAATAGGGAEDSGVLTAEDVSRLRSPSEALNYSEWHA